MKRSQLLVFDGTMERDPAIEAWFESHGGWTGMVARQWFQVMRDCGDEVREVLHDGCPVACLGNVPFGYVNVFRAHASVGFFQGAALPDSTGLLQGAGKFMRHVKLRPKAAPDSESLRRLIDAAFADIKFRVENR